MRFECSPCSTVDCRRAAELLNRARRTSAIARKIQFPPVARAEQLESNATITLSSEIEFENEKAIVYGHFLLSLLICLIRDEIPPR